MASKRKSGTKHVLEWLENDSDDSDFEKEFSDSESEELIEEDDHYFESEQEWSNSDENGEGDAGDSGETVIRAKSGLEWKETPFRANVQHAAKNLVTEKPGPIRVARNSKTSLQIFSLFMPKAMINKITDHRNQKLEKVKERYKSKYDATETSSSENLAVFGITIISGAQQASRQDIEDLWHSDGTGMDLV